jgi:transcriptional regulator with XRE-family HTH domain
MTPEQDFSRLQELDELGLCGYLATRVRRERKKAGLSQAEFAGAAGIPLRTYKRFETHGRGTLETFMRVLKTLGHARNLYLLFPQPLPPRKPTLEERIEAIARRQKSFETS